MKDPHDIIKRPVLTEKTTDQMADKKYTFDVDLRANKSEIKRAVEAVFEVKVDKVNTMNVKGKPKRYGRYSGYTARRKKAIVTLTPESKELDFYEGE
ncbi:50S ribosomal protein L23 [Sporolactobacillus sp. Y61]|jgi:large subunit ribosomal protein L23|uniref:Large ribosomal subunit protein uL23 n=1 Tax=Sporolactobacillus sp. Y61 TaxID=3160863 RepID=A0AAU8IHP8_9BACL|nr:50S ribosomal protein L23 [Sporolactobacillus sp. THM19-2]RYL89380.1 50S ribosomal protein L23 [Sporolactobacillus sp. THM19-2]